MDTGRGNSQRSAEEGDTLSAPLHRRVKVMVLGAPQSGKTTLVHALLAAHPPSSSSSSSTTTTFTTTSTTTPTSSSSSPQVDLSPTEGVNVRLWIPSSVSPGSERTVVGDLRGDEQPLALEVWDTSGRQVCQPVHGMFVTGKTLCVIVFGVTDAKATKTVLTLYKMVRQKCPGSRVVVVGTKSDLLGGHQPDSAPDIMQGVVQALLRQDLANREEIVMEIEETRALIKEFRSGKDHARIAETRANAGKTSSSEGSAKNTPLQQHLTSLQEHLARATGGRSALRHGIASGVSGKGIGELRRVLLDAAVDEASFPHSSSCSAAQQSTALLYDKILEFRERDVIMLPWRQFVEEVAEDEEEEGEEWEAKLEKDVTCLVEMGGLTEFRLGGVRLPTGPPHPKEMLEKKQEDHAGRSHPSLTPHPLPPAPTGPGTVTEERYVCVHPAVFATAICQCLVDDDNKSFRFEAGRFWPKDSGFKRPDPQVLCKFLEAIPQQGLLRECLLPLIWQDLELSADQVGSMLHVLQGEGVVVEVCEHRTHCAGLALPHYPLLSVHRCHALPLLSLLPDNRPQLNWTTKPFVGDIQITWSFQMRAHKGLLQRLLAVTQFLSRRCSSYRHLWRYGVLVRVGEATVCTEMAESEERLAVSCRVNGDEVGREKDAVRMLWVTLTPFLIHIRHFLLRWPGLVFKERVQAFGQYFYRGEDLEEESELPVHLALSLWYRRKCPSFQDSDRELSLDIGFLFPFPPDPTVHSGEGWLDLVLSKTDVILSDVSVTATSPSLPQSLKRSVQRHSMRSSVRHRKKKKDVEIKWQLQEESNSSNNANGKHEVQNDPANNANGNNEVQNDPANNANGKHEVQNDPAKQEPTATESGSQPSASEDTKQVSGFVVSAQQKEAEVVRVASGFVAAILASAFADYVAQEVEKEPRGKKLGSAAQIAAARFTADAALAVHSGNIEGAAQAVISAVKAVKGHHSPDSGDKAESADQRGCIHSIVCVIV